MARRRRKSKGACTTITFKRARKGGKIRARSAWVTVRRCEGRKLKAHNRRQCRRGKAKTFRMRQFVKCK